MEVLAIRQRETDDRADGRVERARRGDFDAFEALYHDQVGRIHAICLRMTADPERARDLTQDTFVQAWLKLAAALHRTFVDGDAEAGAELFKAMAAEHPDDQQLYVWWGRALTELGGSPLEVARKLRRAIEIDPSNVQATAALAEHLVDLGAVVDAERLVNDVASRHPEAARSLTLRLSGETPVSSAPDRPRPPR